MFNDTFSQFIEKLKSGEDSDELKNYFTKSVYLVKLIQEVSFENAKKSLQESFFGILETDSVIEYEFNEDE
jgi:hypothetical protein